MKYFSFMAAVVALLAAPLMMPMNSNSAHAKQLTGTIAAQHLCHDGANRGATVNLKLSWRKELATPGPANPINGRISGNPMVEQFATFRPKGYYTATECIDLGRINFPPGVEHINREFYVWYDTSWWPRLCEGFNIRLVKNGRKVWVQNGGYTVFDANCVLKD